MLSAVLPSVSLCAETGKSQFFILVLVQQMLLSPILSELFWSTQQVEILLPLKKGELRNTWFFKPLVYISGVDMFTHRCQALF